MTTAFWGTCSENICISGLPGEPCETNAECYTSEKEFMNEAVCSIKLVVDRVWISDITCEEFCASNYYQFYSDSCNVFGN